MSRTSKQLHKILRLFILTFMIGPSVHAQTYLENLHEIRENFVTLGDNSYFFAISVSGEQGLWRTDGTQKGTVLINSFSVGEYEVGEMTIYNNALYFAANDPEAGVELWKSDGTTSGTHLFKNLNPSNLGSSWPSNFITYKGMLYFSAIDYYTSGGRRKIFKTDGTPEGTVQADDIIDGYSGFATPVIAEGKLFFIAGTQLYETDGTAEGTRSITIDGLEKVSDLHSFNNGLYFITHNYNKTYIRLYHMTDMDTYVMLKEFSTENYNGLELYGLEEVGDKVVFSLVSGQTYEDVKDTLWATDGTPQGTTEMMSKGGDNSLWFEPHFSGFIPYNGDIYFNAGPATNSALWKTDGTRQGTVEVIPEAGMNSDAPMLVLNDKLYFLRSLTLYTYDYVTKENAPLWQLRTTRKSTADNYFIKSDGRYVYTVVQNDREGDNTYSNMDFFHSGPNPIMKIKGPWDILHETTLSFDSKVDSLIIKEINVQNLGNAPLAFSEIFVSGEGFYINGEVKVDRYQLEDQTFFPQQIAPSQRGIFEIGFLPQKPGVYIGHLILRSNNISQPEFRINLEGYASEVPPESINGTFPTEKEIKWNDSRSQIQLDNRFISENAISGTVVGALTSPVGESFTYQMVPGAGSEDNAIFTINNNQLIIGDEFQVNNKKSYVIRIKATGSGGTELEESFVIGIKEESIEIGLGACEQVAVSLTSDLFSVDFINDTDAIAVGYQGIILKTQDKGATWEQLHVIERTSSYLLPARLYDVNFVNENTGFISGEETLLRTDDAGLSWRPLQMNNLPTFGGFKLIPLSPEVLLLSIESTIYKSTDGGQTWFNLSSTGLYDNRVLYFYNETLGFASDTSENYVITNDGGHTWTKYKLEIEGLGYNQDITDISFVNPESGYAVTTGSKVLKTLDGGLNWTLVNSDYRNQVNEIQFLDDKNGYMVGGSIYETSDGGLTWNTVTLNPCSAMKSISLNGLGDRIAVGIGCYDGNGRTIFNAPAGGSWTEVSHINGTREIRNIVFDGQEGYLFSESQSRRSNDGGITWTEMITPVDGEVSRAEKLDNAILISGYNLSEKYRSTDGGLSWTSLYDEANIIDFDVLDGNTIIAKNEDGNLIKSKDSGNNWITISNVPQDFNGYLDFLNESIGFICRPNGFISTVDGGLAWQDFTVDIENIYIYSFNFVTSQVGFFSSNKGYYKTTDGGQNWIRLSLNVAWSRNLIGIDELEWYIASGNTILRTGDGGISWEPFFSGNAEILDMDRINETIYISDNDGGVYKLIQDLAPLNAGYIKGDRTVRVGNPEIYTVIKHSDNKYIWSTTGENDLVFEDTFARITWTTPGTYVLQVTPYGSCSTGKPTEITVQVYGQMAPPEINGPNQVVESSNGIEYTTSQEDQVSYIWSVTGQQSFQVTGNTLAVDWGAIGLQEIGLIKTDLLSGIRSYNSIEVDVLPLDPFKILQTNASCRETANGSLQIASRISSISYMATLSGVRDETSIEFTDETLFENLIAGTYDLCIEEIGKEKRYCYQFTITEPDHFEVSSKMESATYKEVSLKFKGGSPPYTVFLNGRQVAETSQSTLRLRAESGDILEVLSSGACSLSHSEELHFSGEVKVSPNPVQDSFTVALGNEFQAENQEISVRVFTSEGQLASQFTTNISNHSIHCDVSTLPSGIYIVQVGDNNITSFKIIKK